MRLEDLPLLTDENIHPEVKEFLRKSGHDVLDVKESGLTGTSDLLLLQRAFAENRAVITHDSDFGRLAIAQFEPIIGIIYLRPGHHKADFTIATLKELFRRQLNLSVPFIIVAARAGDRVSIRVR